MYFSKKLINFILISFFAGCAGINLPPAKVTDDKKVEAVANNAINEKPSVKPEPNPAETIKRVKSVEISQKNITIEINKNITLSASVNIESGEQNSAVEWVSSDSSIAVVNSSGVVNALKMGSVTVKAVSIQDNNIFAECIVTVVDPEFDKPTVVEITNSSGLNSIYEKSTLKLSGIVKYVNGTFNSDLLWKSSDDSIATISSDGLVTTTKKGSVTITAVSNKNNSIQANYDITVLEKPVSSPFILPAVIPTPVPTVISVAIDSPSNTTIIVGSNINLTGRVNMSDNTHPNTEVIWSTSDATIATVNSSGTVTPIKPGNVTIRLTSTKDNTKESSLVLSLIQSIPKDIVWELHGNIYAIGLDGTKYQLTTGGIDSYPFFSPDKSKILFQKGGVIWIMNSDGTESKKLADGWSSSWSPDGSKIVFAWKAPGEQKGTIYRMNSDGSNIQRVFGETGNADLPVYSADVSKIAFSSDFSNNSAEASCGGWAIRQINADGSNPVSLIKQCDYSGEDHKPIYSPDGSKIVFYSSRGGNLDIYVMNSDTSGQTNITNNPANDSPVEWFDNNTILFLSDRGGINALYKMNTSGGNVTKIMDLN